jgi:hypothetical protein
MVDDECVGIVLCTHCGKILGVNTKEYNPQLCDTCQKKA